MSTNNFRRHSYCTRVCETVRRSATWILLFCSFFFSFVSVSVFVFVFGRTKAILHCGPSLVAAAKAVDDEVHKPGCSMWVGKLRDGHTASGLDAIVSHTHHASDVSLKSIQLSYVRLSADGSQSCLRV